MRLIELAQQNPWWKYENKFPSKDVDLRKISFLLKRKSIEITPKNIYIIRGIRRCGKTVYLKILIKKLLEKEVDPRSIVYISCDRLTSRRELYNIIKNIYVKNMDKNKIYIFLDEITYLPNWFLVLKNIAESPWIDKLAIVATGSSPIKIREKAERLPGRRIEGNEYYMKPYTFKEFIINVAKRLIKEKTVEKLVNTVKKLSFPPNQPNIHLLEPFIEEINFLLETYLITGGFPEPITNYLQNRKINENIFETIIRTCLGEISKTGKNEATAIGILNYILENISGRTDYITIARKIGIHHETVKDYLETLQNSFMIYVLHCWNLNKKTHAPRKQKKIAISDPFLHHALLKYLKGFEWNDLLDEIERRKPALIESLVISHIAQVEEKPHIKEWWTYLGYYYSNNKEIDIVYKKDNKFTGIEIKYEETIKTRKTPIKTITLSKDQVEYEKQIIPISLFLAGLKKSEKNI